MIKINKELLKYMKFYGNLSFAEQRIFDYFVNNEEKIVYENYSTLARKMKLDKSNFRKAMVKLEKKGIIKTYSKKDYAINRNILCFAFDKEKLEREIENGL